MSTMLSYDINAAPAGGGGGPLGGGVICYASRTSITQGKRPMVRGVVKQAVKIRSLARGGYHMPAARLLAVAFLVC